ncbi:hypothetical protein HPB47_028421, partial [Ixodes persulcatus]
CIVTPVYTDFNVDPVLFLGNTTYHCAGPTTHRHVVLGPSIIIIDGNLGGDSQPSAMGSLQWAQRQGNLQDADQPNSVGYTQHGTVEPGEACDGVAVCPR